VAARRRLDSAEAKLVPGSETAEGPFFSPDSRWVAFAVGVSSLGGGIPAELRKHSLDTGLTQTICPIEDYFGGVWREDGTIVFINLFAQPFWSVPASGGSKRPLGEQFREGGAPRRLPLLWPASLPGDRWLVAVTGERVANELVAVDPSTAELEPLGILGSSPRYLATGHLAFAGLDGTLQVVPFDATARRPTGPPVAMVPGVAFARHASATYAVADDGTLVYATGYLRNSRREPMRVVRASRGGEIEVLPIEADLYGLAFAISPDGRRLALAREDTGSWLVDLRRGTRAKIGGAQLTGQSDVAWSPDGEHLAWSAAAHDESQYSSIYTQPSDGRSDPRPLRAFASDLYLVGWAPDGRALVTSRPGDDAVSFLLERVPLDGAVELLWREPGAVTAGAVSPDGRFLAFETDAGEGYQIALYSLTSGERVGVTSAGGRRPSWSGDGRELYFRRGDSVLAVEVESDARGTPHVGRETKLFDWPAAYLWTAGPDGLFYGLEPVPGASSQKSLHLRTGWFAEVERLAGPGAKR
jgi:eukaryotic-like serine/threonine-protein kinase